jgi:hypothetical protein
MSAIPKTEPEPISTAATSPSYKFDLVADKDRRSVRQPQSEPISEQVAPSRASTLFVLLWIAAIAAVAGSIVWAALANPA